jgi:hypothetical protein
VCKDPHTQPNLLFVATQTKEKREREEREERRRAIFKVINPGIFPVINNIWLVGY